VWLYFPPGERVVDGVLVHKEDEDSWMDALVVAAGPEVPASLGVGVGDTVLAGLFDGLPVFIDGVPLRSIPADKIMAVFE
jgi:co-chaperonin GroES (HSP10)